MSDPIVLATSLLVIVGLAQAGLFVWQLTLIRQSVKESVVAAEAARHSAAAAKLSAEYLAKLERAYLFLEDVETGIDWPATKSDVRNSVVAVTFKNHGKTPAIVKEMYWDVLFGGGVPTLAEAQQIAGGPFPLSVVVGAGQQYLAPEHKFAIAGELVDPIVLGHHNMYVVGRIIYEDVLGARHETHFCRQYRQSSKQFDAAVSDHLNNRT